MDMSQLSDSDLAQIAKGDMRMVSDKGLRILSGETEGPKSGMLANIAAGALKGASDIGATLMAPVAAAANAIGGKGTMLTGAERRAALGGFFKENADPDSLAFKGGELATDIAGTAGAGGVLAKGARLIPALSRMAPALPAALESGGMSLGKATANTGREVMRNAASRMAGGAIAGGASAGLVNPNDAGAGALIGGVLPGVVRVAAEVGKGAKAALYDPLFNQGKIAASTLQRAVGNDAIQNILNTLGAKGATPGVNLSAGQATRDPALNAIEDAMRAANAGGALNRMAGNQRQTLAGALRGLGQDDVALAAAKVAREEAVNPLYTTAKRAQVSGDPVLDELLRRPSMQAAQGHASELASEEGRSFLLQNAKKPVTQFVDEFGHPLRGVPAMPKPPAEMRSLLKEIIDGGGIAKSELPDIGVEGVKRPGLIRKEGSGNSSDDLVEMLQERGWINSQDVENANRFDPGGAHDLARSMVRDAIEGKPVFHPSQDHLAYTYADELGAWGEQYGHLVKEKVPGASAVYSGQGLHDLKIGMDSAIGNPMTGGMDGLKRKAALSTQKEYLAWLESKIPAYGEAKAKFSEMSRPINQMEVGQFLTNKLLPSTSGDIPSGLNAAALATAMRNPDQVAKTATGFKGAKLSSVLTPDQLALVNGVTSDASRIAEAQRLGAGFGSPTARRLATGGYVGEHISESAPMLSNIIGALGGLPGINYLTKGASAVGNMAGKKVNGDIAAMLEDALANNPDELRKLLMMQLSSGSQPALLGGLLSSPVIPIAATRAGLLSQ